MPAKAESGNLALALTMMMIVMMVMTVLMMMMMIMMTPRTSSQSSGEIFLRKKVEKRLMAV